MDGSDAEKISPLNIYKAVSQNGSPQYKLHQILWQNKEAVDEIKEHEISSSNSS
jgi:hypothetical protein